jgi:hypothetical protein
MHTIRVRERTATTEELAEDRRRCLAAKARPPAPAAVQEGNLCACLVTFAAWRKCCVCSRPVLCVDPRCRTVGDVECPACVRVREDLAKRLRPSLPLRAALHLWGLFATSNDNHEARA